MRALGGFGKAQVGTHGDFHMTQMGALGHFF